jgi:hypothetical protein
MNKHRIGALFAALALTLTFAGTAFAGELTWTGQGVTDGQVNTENCDDVDPGELLWIFTDGDATDVFVTVDGNTVGTAVDKGGSWHITTPWLDPLDPNEYEVVVHFTGGDAKNPQFVLSHGCPGETTTTTTEETTTSTEETTTSTEETTTSTEETTTSTEETTTSTEETTTSTEETTTSTTDETTSTTTEETTTSTTDETTSTTSNETTPEGSVEELTPPQTDTLSQPTSSSSVSTGLLLVLAGILAAVLVVVPAAARNRR